MDVSRSRNTALVILLIAAAIVFIANQQPAQNAVNKIGAYLEVDPDMSINQINEMLAGYEYDVNDRIIYVMSKVLNSSRIVVDKHQIQNNETLSLSFPRDSLVIVSLHSNATLPYSWSFSRKTESDEIVKLDGTLEMAAPVNGIPEPGVNNDRINYYFRTVEDGDCLLQFHYDRTDNDKYKPDEFYFDPKIQVQ